MAEAEKNSGAPAPFWRKAIPYVLAVGALLIFAYYLYQNAGRYRALFTFSWTYLFALVVLVLLVVFGNGLVNFILYRGLGTKISLNESVGLATINTLANLLPFAAGMVTKGVYLKRRHRLAYRDYFSATLALFFIFLPTAGLLGLFILSGRSLLGAEPSSPLLILGFSLMVAGVAMLWFPFHKIPLPQRWQNRLLQLISGWQILGRKKIMVITITFVYLLMMLALSGRYWITFHALSQNVTYADCILYAAASMLTQLVSITPGGLGVREGIVAAVAAIHGIPPDISILAVGLDRLVATTVVAALGTLYSFYLGRQAIAEELAGGIPLDEKTRPL